jgi:beta-lactamase regulating signal transducer with metallopeptidase domain
VDLGAPMPVLAIDEPLPTVAVIGFGRPVLFIAEQVLRECTPAELGAMICHETAHVTGRDNWKRFIVRACPDLVSRGSTLERAWCAAVEQAADAAAVASRPSVAMDLAQALIRVARLAPMPALPEFISAFYRGGSIETRVRRLVEPPVAAEGLRPAGCLLMCAMAAILTASVIAGAPAVQQFFEVAIRRLP